MAELTKREKIRRRSRVQKTVILAGAVVVVLGVIGLLAWGISGVLRPLARKTADAVATPPPAPEEETVQEYWVEPLPPADINSWELRLVRGDAPLPSDFVPELAEIERGEQFDARASVNLQKLISDARAAGYTVYVCSCYRSYDTQYLIYWNHVNEYMSQGMTQEQAEAATRLAVNYPGGSEHQLGLAADILESSDQAMEPYIGGSGLMLWLEQNCADYGFVIRYPDGKTDITGVEYEPWHLRYVGSAARYIMDNGLCLEEFLDLYD